MKYTAEELTQLIWVDKLSYREIGRRYNVSDTYIKKIAGRLGIILPERKKFPPGFTPANKGTSKIHYCINCGSQTNVFATKYCSRSCQAEYQMKENYKDFLLNNDKYCRENYTPTNFKYIFLKEQNYKCSVCSIPNEWNNKKLVFVLDHIDGNAANNKRENLRLVCPNCDSQLDTFKSKNKNSARKQRYLKQRK